MVNAMGARPQAGAALNLIRKILLAKRFFSMHFCQPNPEVVAIPKSDYPGMRLTREKVVPCRIRSPDILVASG